MGRLRSIYNAVVGRSMSVDQMKDMVKAAFYSAASDSASMDFSFATDAGINRALLSDLQRLRTRCRYELKQNGVAKGLPRIYANSVVGRGPRISISGGTDPAWNKRAEVLFTRWARSSDMMGGGSLGIQVHQCCRQLFGAGEYFLVPRSKAGSEIQLRYLAIRPDRVKNPFNSPAIIDNGVEVDKDGVPVAYHVLKDDPDNAGAFASATAFDFDRVPVEKIIHVFYREEPNQHRGEPWLATSLPVWHKLRRYDEATVAAAIVAAKFAAVLVNLNPAAVEDAGKILPTTVLDIQDGMMMVPPPGYEPRQVTPQHPSANATDFRRDQIAAAGAANAIPANIASQDSSRSNFASARFDGVTFTQEGAVAREMIETLHLDRIWAAWIREATAAGLLPEIGVDPVVSWLWLREDRHSDPSKQAGAEETRLKSATTTVGKIVMEDGNDNEQFREELLEEVTWFRDHGLAHPLDAKPTTSGRPPQGDENALSQ